MRRVSSADAFMSDVAPFMALDATADFSRDEHLMALQYVAKRVGRVETTDALIESITASACRRDRETEELTASLR